jgi:hypothetical protein
VFRSRNLPWHCSRAKPPLCTRLKNQKLPRQIQTPLWHIVDAVIVGLKRRKSPGSRLRVDLWSARLALPAVLTPTLPISVALLTTTTIRLLFLLPGFMVFAALLSALALHVASPRSMTAKGPGDEAFGPKLDVYHWPGDP